MAKELSDEAKKQKIESLYAGYRKFFSKVEDITAEELLERREREHLIPVDVRTPAERAVSMIPGAITEDEVDAVAKSHPEAAFVTYCTMGYRSGRFARKLQRRGYKVLNLAGSILAWTHAGGELVSDDGPTRRVHVFGMRWNLAASDYEPVL